MHLRFLQSLVQVSAENNHTVVLPVPVDIITKLLDHKDGGAQAKSEAAGESERRGA
jgi:hypothetical protein